MVDSGTRGRGSYDHIRVAISGPSWLVLGEGYNRGWRAWCDGHGLGSPTPIDGYANGWRIGPGCERVHFAFAPNSTAEIGYLVSGVAGLMCVVLLCGGLWVRTRRPATAGSPAAEADEPAPFATPRADSGFSPAPALLVAVAAGAAFGFVFGLRAGVLSVPAIALILWRGIGARALTLTAGALLGIVVPVLYLVHTGPASGGNHYSYAMAHLAAQWVGVASLGLLIGALWRTLNGRD